jgi:hypothetical protein
VVSGVEPQFTTAVEEKLVPAMVSVKAAPPAMADVGLRLVRVGIGGLMVRVAPEEVPPAVVTVTLAVPVAAIRLAGTAAVNLVVLT